MTIRKDENLEFIMVSQQPALQNQTFTQKMFCCVLGGLGKREREALFTMFSYYELLQSGQTITADCYQEQMIRVSDALEKKRPFTCSGKEEK